MNKSNVTPLTGVIMMEQTLTELYRHLLSRDDVDPQTSSTVSELFSKHLTNYERLCLEENRLQKNLKSAGQE